VTDDNPRGEDADNIVQMILRGMRRPAQALVERDRGRAIDAAATRQDVTTNADLMRFVSQIDQTSNAWIVGRFDAVSQSASLPAEVRDRIPPVQWIAASARLNGGIQATLKAETRDDQSGEQLRDVVRGALAMALTAAIGRWIGTVV